jgi:hypothetical protein
MLFRSAISSEFSIFKYVKCFLFLDASEKVKDKRFEPKNGGLPTIAYRSAMKYLCRIWLYSPCCHNHMDKKSPSLPFDLISIPFLLLPNKFWSKII